MQKRMLNKVFGLFVSALMMASLFSLVLVPGFAKTDSTTSSGVTGNMITNGDFEENSLSSFLTTASTRAVISSANPHEGANSLLMTPTPDTANFDNSANYVRQQIAVEPNKTYKWTLYVYCSWGAAATLDDIMRFGVHSAVSAPDSLITSVDTPGLATALSNTYKNYYIKKSSMTQNKWYQINVIFDSGSLTSVYLGCAVLRTTKADPEFIGYTDDWTLAPYTPPVYVPGVITNGNFENGLDGYREGLGYGFFNGQIETGTVPGTVGTKILKISTPDTNNDAKNRIYQEIAVEAGKTYKWSFNVKLDKKDGVEANKYCALVDVYSAVPSDLGDSSHKLSKSIKGANSAFNASIANVIQTPSTATSGWGKCEITFEATNTTKAFLLLSNSYAGRADLYTDNWSLIEVVPVVYPEGVLISAGFEGANEDAYSTRGDAAGYWSKSSEAAHTGKYSAKYDASNEELGWLELTWTDVNGNSAINVKVEPKTTYKFSYWYKANGDFSLVKAASFYNYMSYTEFQYVVPSGNDWQYAEWVFTTDANTTSLTMKIAGCFYDTTRATLFIDDISMKKVNPSIMDDKPSALYCEDFFNKLKNGNMEASLTNTIWDVAPNKMVRVKATDTDKAQAGNYYSKLTDTADYSVTLNLVGGRAYTFAYSYRATKKSDMTIGITFPDGKPIEGEGFFTNSLISPSEFDGKWHREGYTFFTPGNGVVTFVLKGSNLNIDLDEISLFFARLSYEENPNDYMEVANQAAGKAGDVTTIIPDTGEEFFKLALILLFALILVSVPTGLYVKKHYSHQARR